ncbi:MAG: hypothetical protein IPJ49_25960 [Candidatus Obscuribacter sp.]|nr:hypothetical protein [Candidatus Obscuribacter sp.]
MANNKVILKSPEAYVEYCLQEISREISMAAASQDVSSILIESLQEIQGICNTGLQNTSISARIKSLKEIGQQIFYLEDSCLSERETSCLQRIQGHVSRSLKPELELANSRSQILKRKSQSQQ